jgi:sterol desaturase/sphingolipid hydroxylase (fatty acid hydroxylase superfamily)
MFVEAAERLLQFLIARFGALFLGPGSSLSAASLVSALCIAVVFLVARRRRDKRQVRYRVLARALFPRWLRRPSFRADIGFLLLNVLASAMLVGWAIVSGRAISDIVSAALTGVFGVLPETGLNELTAKSIATAFLFLAYEFAYWFDHYLSHRIPLLWDFHRVHHTAEVLSPLTNFRVHPVDSLVFGNILGLSMGITGGVLAFLQLGSSFEVGGTNLILVAFFFVTVHLQHSHVWMATTGLLGRVIMSPAHHQIHHSDSPKHFNKNFGSCLSIWDWIFGTLHVPERKRERLTFGVATRAREHHTAVGSLLLPFVHAAKRLRPRPSRVRRVREADRAADSVFRFVVERRLQPPRTGAR